jgi:hypothetical protein
MNNSQLAHAWAHQTKPQAKGSNLFFEGDTIYSYGYHFPIAKKVAFEKVLFTTREYSNTTARHKSLVARAIPSAWLIISIPHFRKCNDNLSYFESEFSNAIEKYKKSRKYKDSIFSDIIEELKNFRAYCDAFQVPFEDFSDNLKALLFIVESESFAETQEERQARIQRQDEQEKKRRKKELLDLTDKIEAWKRGEQVYGFYQSRGSLAFLRVKGDKVETSQGASVPVSEALRLFHFIQSIQGDFIKESCKVGDFTFTELSNGVATIGCHKIALDEMKRILAECEAVETEVAK